MESNNTFNGGMNQDLSKLIVPNNQYFSATNMRPISELGATGDALESIRGNNFEKDIPDVWNVYKLRVTNTTSTPMATSITVLGYTTPLFNVTNTTTGLDLYNQLILLTGYGTAFEVAYNNTDVVIWSTTDMSSVDPNVTFSSAGINYVVSNGSPNVFLPAITGLFPIGSTHIRDKIYLFTCNSTSSNPGGHDPNLATDASELGQIWEIVYDYTEPSTTNTTIRLIYTNYLDFTREHPIPPTAAEGRYENSAIQRIYWTDNFNAVRTLNVTNTNAMALDVSLIDITPSIDFSVPILQEVAVGGSLKYGAYQAAYRLKNYGGSLTAYSVPSNIVYIAGGGYADNVLLNEDQYRSYIGGNYGGTTSKNITWKIQDLDLDFNQIEIIILKREILTDVPEIAFVIDDVIPADGTYQFTYTGNEYIGDVTIDEFYALGSTFTHAKTMATKDNILFLGNIRNQQSDLDFDTRAYRGAITTGSVSLEDSQGNAILYTQPNLLAKLTALPETIDAINSDQDTYKYQLNGTTIGGEGPNIKYTFGTILIPADSFSDWNNVSTGSAAQGWKHVNAQTAGATNTTFGTGPVMLDSTNTTYIDGINLQEFPTNQVNSGNKLPYQSTLLQGYKRNEIYRFAFQGYNKQKNPYFAKWIADIKMPDYADTNANAIWLDGTSASSVVTDFRTSYINSSASDRTCYVCQLYIQFEVTIPPAISSVLGGYSIVRCERTKDDMTISGQGILLPFEFRGNTDWEICDQVRQPRFYNSSASELTGHGMMICPDWLLDPGLYHGYGGSTDNLRIIGEIDNYNMGVADDGFYRDAFALGVDYYNQDKVYRWSSLTAADNPVTGLQYFPENGYIANGGVNYYNEATTGATRTAGDIYSVGSACHWFEVSSAIQFRTGLDIYTKYMADYVRGVVTQYGGNTYTARTRNEYMLCNHFRPIEISSSTITDTPNIFGGDTWVNIFDVQKAVKNWNITPIPANKRSGSIYFPVETRINIPMRTGNFISHNLDHDDGTLASAQENYDYNNVYNNGNDILKFYPKPLLFSNVEEWDNRVIYSEVKINGEDSDSWTQFKPNNYYDVEGSYGPINAILTLSGYDLYFLQDRGFGKLSINPTVTVNTTDGLPTILGTGQVIQSKQYIATGTGTKHQWSVSKSDRSLLFIDTNKNRIYRYNGTLACISDDKNMCSFMTKEILYGITVNDNPLLRKGIITTYDYQNGEYLITFLNTNTTPDYSKYTTLVFNEFTDTFTSFYSFTPTLYINNGQRYYTYNNRVGTTGLYLHNMGNICEFYGISANSSLKLIVNSNPSLTKVLDNISWHTEVIDDTNYPVDTDNINMFPDTWDTIRIYNDYQNTDVVTLDSIITKNIRRVERTWNMQCPRNKVLYSTSSSPNIFTDLGNKTYGERLRDKTFTVELEYNNPSNYKLVMHYLKTSFRVSPR